MPGAVYGLLAVLAPRWAQGRLVMSVAIPFTRFWRLEYSAGGGLATAQFSQRVGAILGWVGQRLDVAPNHLTMASLAVSVAASSVFAFAPNTWLYALTCLLLYQVAYGFDCADGQLARASGRASDFGAWLDVSCDCISGIVLAFALLYYASEQADPSLATLLIVCLLTFGRVLALYSSKAVRSSPYAEDAHSFRVRGLARTGLWLVIDTPVFLAGLCLLRPEPSLVLAYALFMGIAYLANAVYNGARLRPPGVSGQDRTA